MNAIIIAVALMNLVCSILFIVKKRAYFSAAAFLVFGVYLLTLTRMDICVVHHQPMIALYKNYVLIVLDSNKTVYTDSLYERGVICLDEEVSKNIYGHYSHEKMTMNTQCQ